MPPDHVDATSPDRSPDDAGLQRQARALGSPTRFAIFQHVAEAGTPVRIAALASRFGLNHNAVRQHLGKLCEAGLLVEELAARNGPGRPALQYRLAAEAVGTWGTASRHEELALLLLEMAAEGLSAREVGQRAGRLAAATADLDGATPLDLVLAGMRRRGFEPPGGRGGAGVELVLDCPPLSVGPPAHSDIVCEIHRGLVEGLLDGLATGLEVVARPAGNAGATGCRLELRRRAPEAGET